MNTNTALIDLGFHTLDIADMANTTENALAQTRANMTIYKARDTVRRDNWYITEPEEWSGIWA